MSNVRISPRLLVAALAVGLLFVSYREASAGNAPLVVNTTAETFDGACGPQPEACSVGDAISSANLDAGADTINFAVGLNNFTFTAPLPSANGADGLAIDATNGPVTFTHQGATAGDGLLIQSATGVPLKQVTVRNVNFVGYKDAGLFICGGLASNTCSDGDVQNVTLDHVGSFGNTLYGVRIWGSNVSTVNVNTLDTENNGFDGLSIIGQAAVAGVSSVTGVDVASHTSFSDRVGIAIASAADIVLIDIGGSHISQGTTGIAIQGISTSYVELHGNIITDESFVGIGFQQGNLGDTLFITVEDNIIERTGTGDGLFFSTPVLFASDIIDNQIRDTGGRGINLDSTEDYNGVTVTGNTVERTGGEGIHLSAPDEVLQSQISGNTVTSATGVGIFLSGVQFSSNTISGNTVSLSGFDGIHVQAGAPRRDAQTDNTVTGNTVFGNGGDGIEIAPNGVLSFAVVTISQNSTRDNGEIGIDLYAQTDPSPGVTLNDAGDTDNGPNGLLTSRWPAATHRWPLRAWPARTAPSSCSSRTGIQAATERARSTSPPRRQTELVR